MCPLRATELCPRMTAFIKFIMSEMKHGQLSSAEDYTEVTGLNGSVYVRLMDGAQPTGVHLDTAGTDR